MERFFCEVVPINITNPSQKPIQLTTELSELDQRGTYELSYAVPVQGQYELTVKLFEQHVPGSPFRVCF